MEFSSGSAAGHMGPLTAAAQAYIGREAARFHMPGHKGRGPATDFLTPIYPYDLTEVHGMDSLFEASGPIFELETRYAALYGAKHTLLSTGGSTLCIQAMLTLASHPGGVVVAGRGVHISAVNAMALLGLTPVWMLPEGSVGFGMGGKISPHSVETALTEHPDACCVYVTSPDYFGVLSDIAGIAAVCKRFDVPLLVDNAHGTHLKWMPGGSRHPLDLGAAMCCDSPHKTLPVLTGGALLHIADERFVPDAKRAMALFGSTSPSYLIMLSLDHCCSLLENGYGARFAAVYGEMLALEQLAEQRGFVLLEGEHDGTKLALSIWNWAVEPDAFATALRESGIEPEYCGVIWSVLMASPENTAADYARVRRFLERWHAPEAPRAIGGFTVPLPEAAIPLRDAALAKAENVPVEQCCGRISAVTACPCPPGIPIVLPGERIGPNSAVLLKKCGIRSLDVVK